MKEKIIEILREHYFACDNLHGLDIADRIHRNEEHYADQIIKLVEEIVPEGKVIKMPAEGIGEVVETYYNNGFNTCRTELIAKLKEKELI